MLKTKSISFHVGGQEHTVNANDVGPETTLNTYLRENAHLTGTKRMCLEGGCGSCNVVVEKDVNGKKTFLVVNSCLVSIYSCSGWQIYTIEGIGNPLIGYHQIQKILSDNYGTQCGWCSPGMVMTMYGLQQSGPKTKEEIENSFGGNICRCTGYRPILNAFKQLASDADVPIADIEELKLCPKVPGKICNNECKEKSNFFVELGNSRWTKVHRLQDLLEVLKVTTVTNYILVAGNTARGVYKNGPIPDLYIDVKDVVELTQYSITADRLQLGGNVTLTNFINICKENASKTNFSYLDAIADHIDLIATVPVRNIGTIAGNLMIKHQHNEFPSDIFLLLETFNATLIIVDEDGNETFGSPKTFLNENMRKKVIKSVVLNALDSSYKYGTYKIMPRAQNAHAHVNAGFLIRLGPLNVVQKSRIVFGGINPNFVHATKAENFLILKPLFLNLTLKGVLKSLDDELEPDHVLPDPSPEFRKNLAIALFYKFILKICPPSAIPDRFQSGGTLLKRPLSTGSQEYGTVKSEWPLTQPITKLESLAQTSGQAKYIMDRQILPGEVFAAFVTCKAPAGSSIVSIDPSNALKVPGVVAYYDKKDIPGINNFTPTTATIFYVNEELFCSGVVQYYDQPLGIIVAIDQELAWKVSELVQVTYGPPQYKAYLNVKDVVSDNAQDRIKNLFHVVPKSKGDDVKKVIKGEFYVGAQYHYYMEVQECKVVPTDDDGYDMYPSTQWMDSTLISVATVLGIPNNKINIKVRRLGGAYGGKISRNNMVSAAAALAAFKLKVPVTMILSLEQNMNIIGKRYPLLTKYEVGVNDKGVIQYLDADLYSDFGVGGNDPFYFLLVDLFQSCYNSNTWEFSIYLVKTDTHANTYTRAPGTTEGLACIESIMDDIAYTLNLDRQAVRSANFNPDVPMIPKYLTDLKTWGRTDELAQDVINFNKDNRWMKRGLSVVPMRWMFSFMGNFSVIVSIFHADGSVALTHSGIEIGQGINTKAAQVCAFKFGISLDQVSIKPSNNNVVPNSFVTGGSLTSESICFAVTKACDTLLERMKPIRDKMSNPTWPALVKKCFESNIQLYATGFMHKDLPEIHPYPIYGVCAVLAEVDILTGRHQILSADIIEDVGNSMSPLIDIGQVEGAFVMGIGYYTSEELIYDSQGKLLTNRTWNYKPPGAKDIPISFRIKFPENNPNPVGILQSKAMAEPPTCLSVAIPLAIRNAVASARQESSNTSPQWVPFDGPTTVEKTFLYSLNNYQQYHLKI